MDRRFIIVWFGQVVSQFGTALSGFGAAVWVFVETGSFLWLAVLTVAVTLPPLVGAPLTGIVDRFDRRLVMMAADSGAAVATAVVVLVWAVADLRPWHLIVASFVAGVCGSFQGPAYAAAIPSLVGGESVERANGLIQLGPSLAIVAAPGTAGLLIAGAGIGSVFIIDLATFALALGSLLAVRFRAFVEASPGDSYRLADAAIWLWSQARAIAYLIGVLAVVNFMLAIFNLSILARGAQLGGEAAAGLAPTVGGIGMVIVSLIIGARGAPRRRMRAAGWAIAVFGLLMIVAVARPSLALLVVCVALGLSTGPLVQTIITTTFHERVQPSMHGRVFGLRNAVGRGTHPLGALVAGGLATWSLTGAMVASGLALVVVGGAVGFSRRLQPLDTAVPQGT